MSNLNFKYLPVFTVTTLVGLGQISVAAAQDNTFSVTQATIQAEDYVRQRGTRLDQTGDPVPGTYVGWINNNESTTYDIDVVESGTYVVDARVSSNTRGGTITFRAGDRVVGTLDVGNTGGWQSWVVESTTLQLEAGKQLLTLEYTDNGASRFLLNVDYFDVQLSDTSTPPPVIDPPVVVNPPIEEPPVIEPPVVVNPPIEEPPVIEPPVVVNPPRIDPLPGDPTITETGSNISERDKQAASFLMAASFGPTTDSIRELASIGPSEWFKRQQRMRLDTILSDTNPTFADTTHIFWETVPRTVWYERAINAEDQLRQRAAFALSEIFVVSTQPRNWLFKSHLHASYMDIMQEGVFGNFRDLLQDVTYSPLMGEWLTYIGNEKANEQTGNAPDENYARELMQLFTIGLVELDESGQPRRDSNGEIIETYDTTDVTELAKVFTGLWWDSNDRFGSSVGRPANRTRDTKPMRMYDAFHSPESKRFLGHTIPAGTNGTESVKQALDVLFEHPNTAPFIGKQLIQRLTTSNPSPAYVSRVSRAFNSGTFTLPDGDVVGSGERGDMAPVWAAILFDQEARQESRFADITFGKVREPVIRWIHWARVSKDVEVNIAGNRELRLDNTTNSLGQTPYRSRSVFNFFRPGFRAGGTLTSDNNLVAPELQITTSTTVVDYLNFMRGYIFNDRNNRGWMASYSEQIALAEDADALIEHLNVTMTAGRMTSRTKDALRETVNSVNVSGNASRRNGSLRDRVQLAMLLVASSPEFNTQQ